MRKTSTIVRSLTLLLLLVGASAAKAQSEPKEGIVSTDRLFGYFVMSDVVRIKFNYLTVDTDLTTPVMLSAAMFLSEEVYNKQKSAPGLALLNHYTITDSTECPTLTTTMYSLEFALANSGYVVVESDNIGFGLTLNRAQPYLEGELTARQNIDALLAARKILAEEGYTTGDKVANMGYSQGGHSTMWVARLVSEGYRSDELPKLDMSIAGAGPYDILGTYHKWRNENFTQYPIAAALMLNGYVQGRSDFGLDDVLGGEIAGKIPGWLSSKGINTESLNDSIFHAFGATGDSLAFDRLTTDVARDSTTAIGSYLVGKFRQNTLTEGEWAPANVDSIHFVHSPTDEVVPVLCLDNMVAYLDRQGYTAYTVDTTYHDKHTTTATHFAAVAMAKLAALATAPTNIKTLPEDNGGAPVKVYNMAGQLAGQGNTAGEATENLPRGMYIVGGKKMIFNK